jgi:hypothetical protein
MLAHFTVNKNKKQALLMPALKYFPNTKINV